MSRQRYITPFGNMPLALRLMPRAIISSTIGSWLMFVLMEPPPAKTFGVGFAA